MSGQTAIITVSRQDSSSSPTFDNKKRLKLFLVIILVILLTLGLSSFFWYRFISKKNPSKISSVYEIELPGWLKKEELNHLSPDQQKLLNGYIEDYLSQLFKKTPLPSKYLPITVVLTQNGRPLWPISSPPPYPGGFNPTAPPASNQTPNQPGSTPNFSPGTIPSNSPSPTPSPSALPSISSSPYASPANSPKSSPVSSPQLVTDLFFNINHEASENYQRITHSDLWTDINLFYTEAKQVYGFPFRTQMINVAGSDSNQVVYNITTHTIILGKMDEEHLKFNLINALLSAFHADLIYYMPENWEVGMKAVSAFEIFGKLYQPIFDKYITTASLYEIYNFPAIANLKGVLYSKFSLPVNAYDLVVTALYQPYKDNRYFFQDLNSLLYQQTLDSQLYQKVNSLANTVMSTFLHQPFNNWLSQQYILSVNPIPGRYLNIQMFPPNSPLIAEEVEVRADGIKYSGSFLPSTVTAWDNAGNKVWDMQQGPDEQGIVDFLDKPQVSPDYTGCVKFLVDAHNFHYREIYYPYQNGQPANPENNGLYGCVVNQSIGNVMAHIWFFPQQGAGYTVSLDQGAYFVTDPEFINHKGTTEVYYYPDPVNQSPPLVHEVIGKIPRYLFHTIQAASLSSTSPNSSPISSTIPKLSPKFNPTTTTPSPAPASPTSFSSPQTPAQADCANGWQTRTSTNFNISVKYPSTWTHDSPGRSSSEGPNLVRFALTDWPYGQAPDSNSTWDNIDVVASYNDLRHYSDTDQTEFSEWLDDATGLQQKSNIIFHGLSAEKYILDLTSIGSSTYSEKYYFKGGSIYYLIRSHFYLNNGTDRTEKLAILQCFLENFRFLDD